MHTPWRDLPAGARVVVRRRLDATEAARARAEGRGAVWTDIIGVVLAVDDEGLSLRTDAPRDPSPREVSVAAGEIEAVKRIGPRPARRAPRRPR
ncbi:DUF6725 family protein [Xylanimonas ulmi]|uniref:Uncharacterized protein n=1 Tax=Xylanimonas ulmi TaxID=228973 RepID=A0A4Q7M1Q1_9MICO|nr:DUF6725 family protein [Xylanibacterium ulmi]RZS61765.1 hypothetical protein EV386_2076 [Xylanibacterium ulmi]